MEKNILPRGFKPYTYGRCRGDASHFTPRCHLRMGAHGAMKRILLPEYLAEIEAVKKSDSLDVEFYSGSEVSNVFGLIRFS